MEYRKESPGSFFLFSILEIPTQIFYYTVMRKMDLEEVGRGCGNWVDLAQDRDRWRALVSTVMNFRVP